MQGSRTKHIYELVAISVVGVIGFGFGNLPLLVVLAVSLMLFTRDKVLSPQGKRFALASSIVLFFFGVANIVITVVLSILSRAFAPGVLLPLIVLLD